jgi:hypothetical protein
MTRYNIRFLEVVDGIESGLSLQHGSQEYLCGYFHLNKTVLTFVDSVLGLSCHVVMFHVALISEVHASSIFSVEVCRVEAAFPTTT